MDRPTRPLSKESLEMTANRAEKNTTRFPRNSRRMASHLRREQTHTQHAHKYKCVTLKHTETHTSLEKYWLGFDDDVYFEGALGINI